MNSYEETAFGPATSWRQVACVPRTVQFFNAWAWSPPKMMNAHFSLNAIHFRWQVCTSLVLPSDRILSTRSSLHFPGPISLHIPMKMKLFVSDHPRTDRIMEVLHWELIFIFTWLTTLRSFIINLRWVVTIPCWLTVIAISFSEDMRI